METERDIIRYIEAGKLALPPMSFAVKQPNIAIDQGTEADLLLEGSWEDRRYKFAADVKRYGSDRAVLESANQARYVAVALKANPLVVAPWISEAQLVMLEQTGVSGLDLCGNGAVVIPGEFLIFRPGQPNKYPLSRTVKRVYQGTSSLVPLVFPVKPSSESVSQVLKEITARGGKLTLPTVSKALKQLEEDLIIERSNGQIRLHQADKLLDRLKANYEAPRVLEQTRCKLTIAEGNVATLLNKVPKSPHLMTVLSGASSVESYATMGKDPVDIYYCRKIPLDGLRRRGAKIDILRRFPNTEFIGTDSDLVYFDMRVDGEKNNIASPVQTYLELAKSDKRGQETAEQIRETILKDLPSGWKRHRGARRGPNLSWPDLSWPVSYDYLGKEIGHNGYQTSAALLIVGQLEITNYADYRQLDQGN